MLRKMKFYQTTLYFQHLSEHKSYPFKFIKFFQIVLSFPTPAQTYRQQIYRKVSERSSYTLLTISISIFKDKEERIQTRRAVVFSRNKTVVVAPGYLLVMT